MNTKTAGISLALLIAAVIAWWLLGERAASESHVAEGSHSEAARDEVSDEAHGGSAAESGALAEGRRADGGTDAHEAPVAPNPQPNVPVDPERAAADEYRRRIREALQDDIAAAGAEDRDFTGRLDPQYIRDAVREIRPLIRECYDMTIEAAQAAGEPIPEGRLVTEFTFVGAQGEGGIVETSAIDENSEIDHPVLGECLSETLYTLELPAPEEGGRIMVRYPFRFSQAPDDEESARD